MTDWLRELETLERLSTPGEWRSDVSQFDDIVIWQGEDLKLNVGARVTEVGILEPNDQVNAQLICLLRNHASELISAYRELQWRDELEKASGTVTGCVTLTDGTKVEFSHARVTRP